MYFRFRQVKSKFIGDVLMNRQNGATLYSFFFLLQLALPIVAPNHPALLGDARWTKKNPRNKIWKLLTQQIRTVLSIGARCFSISLHYIETKSNVKRIICWVFPIYVDIAQRLCSTWQKRKYIENKDDSKIKLQTNLDPHGPRPIPNVCHLPDPLVSHYRQPFR